MVGYPDTASIDSHECELEPIDSELEDDEIDENTQFACRLCGTKTTPAVGVKAAKRSRLW